MFWILENWWWRLDKYSVEHLSEVTSEIGWLGKQTCESCEQSNKLGLQNIFGMKQAKGVK